MALRQVSEQEYMATLGSDEGDIVMTVPLSEEHPLLRNVHYTLAGKIPHIEDPLLEWITNALKSQFNVGASASQMRETVVNIERRLRDAVGSDEGKNKLVRGVGPHDIYLHCSLPVCKAFDSMNAKYRFTSRRHVPPTIHEVRQVVNLSFVMGVASRLRLLSFDGDDTLYPDGLCFNDLELAKLLAELLIDGIYIAVVTAAGYGTDATPYEDRLRGFLEFVRVYPRFKSQMMKQVFLMAGECNYLFQGDSDYRLHLVPYEHWEIYSTIKLSDEATKRKAEHILSTAEAVFSEATEDMNLRARVIRKHRAVGLVPGGITAVRTKPLGSGARSLRPEILNECIARVKEALPNHLAGLEYTVFSGGGDVWLDIGSKAEGLGVLLKILQLSNIDVIHFGDQFSRGGNDVATRRIVPTCWVMNPSETKSLLRKLLRARNLKVPGVTFLVTLPSASAASAPTNVSSVSTAVPLNSTENAETSTATRPLSTPHSADVASTPIYHMRSDGSKVFYDQKLYGEDLDASASASDSYRSNQAHPPDFSARGIAVT